jgi:hypothetical protein
VKKLSADERAAFRAQLTHDPQEDFDTYWARTSRLRYELVRDYGGDGVQLWLEDDVFVSRFDAFYEAGQIPPDAGCPWELPANASPAAIITTIFAPLTDHLPQTIALLREHCRGLFVLRHQQRWRLLYLIPRTLYGGQEYWQIVAGGPPLADPVLPEEPSKHGWRMPAALRFLYSVHDGLGDLLHGSHCVLSCEKLQTLSLYVNSEEEGLPYDTKDLLEFYPDGVGNGQYFHRRSRRDPDPPTVDWDHETRELSGERDFFDFLDERLIELEEE